MKLFARFSALAAATGLGCALAQTPPAPPPCADSPSHQFDFWIGDWDVYNPQGKLVGVNRIAPLYGCVLHESWRAPKVEGQSFNRYDADRGLWHQTWVDNGGSLLLLEGGLKDGAMVMSDADIPARKAAMPINEVTWSRQADGSVRQLWRTSKDGGKAWQTSFDGKYVRSTRPQPQLK